MCLTLLWHWNLLPSLLTALTQSSRMLGSLNVYRRLLHENVFTKHGFFVRAPAAITKSKEVVESSTHKLPVLGHALAGVMAGWTVSVVAAPVEHVKARLQIQYAADKRRRLYSGPIDCSKKIVATSRSPYLETLPF